MGRKNGKQLEAGFDEEARVASEAAILLREIRKAKKEYTLRSLGAKIGVSKSYLSKLESGTMRYPLFMFLAVCDRLKVDPGLVLQRAKERADDKAGKLESIRGF